MADFADLGCELETQQRERALREQADRAAADCVAQPTGYCDDCGEQIPHARLQVNPHAKRCLHCQAVVEQHRALRR